jgi:predicted amidohydrolase
MSDTAQAPAAYSALALQVSTDCVNAVRDPADARRMMMASIQRIGAKLRSSKGFVQQYNGTEVKLVVLPEYFLSGFPMGEDVPTWIAKACLDPQGAEYDALAQIAQSANVFLAGNVYETDANFPDLYFQCCFIIDPLGHTVLRYRRLISLYAPSPCDLWSRYLDLYGMEGVFPVADTEIGRLAAIASEEILYPEVARCLLLRGAEVFVHPTSEVGSPQLTPKEIAKRARAIENMAYVVSANSASLDQIPFPAASTSGMSKVIDYYGNVLSEANPGGESMVSHALINLQSLRATRRRTGLTNMVSRLPLQVFAESYRDIVFRGCGRLSQPDGSYRVPTRGEMNAWQEADIEELTRRGLI